MRHWNRTNLALAIAASGLAFFLINTLVTHWEPAAVELSGILFGSIALFALAALLRK